MTHRRNLRRPRGVLEWTAVAVLGVLSVLALRALAGVRWADLGSLTLVIRPKNGMFSAPPAEDFAELTLDYEPTRSILFITDDLSFLVQHQWVHPEVERKIRVPLRDGAFTFGAIPTALLSIAGYKLTSAAVAFGHDERGGTHAGCRAGTHFPLGTDQQTLTPADVRRWMNAPDPTVGFSPRSFEYSEGTLRASFHCSQDAPPLPTGTARATLEVDYAEPAR